MKAQRLSRGRLVLLVLLLNTVGLACRDDSSSKAPPVNPQALGLPLIDMQGPIGGDRPVEVKTPANYDASKRYPLLLVLHGYGSDGEEQDRYLNISSVALAGGYIYAAPNGTLAPQSGRRFWNAGEICCNFEGSTVDDVAYLRDLIRQISARYAVDPGRVYLFGHSNGAFMAHRMACDQTPWITGIAALAGSLRADPLLCQAIRSIVVLDIHGTADEVIKYAGGQLVADGPRYPSAEATTLRWASLNGCHAVPIRSLPFSLLQQNPSLESTAIRYASCQSGGQTELWSIEGGNHVPAFKPEFIPRVLDFFAAARR